MCWLTSQIWPVVLCLSSTGSVFSPDPLDVADERDLLGNYKQIELQKLARSYVFLPRIARCRSWKAAYSNTNKVYTKYGKKANGFLQLLRLAMKVVQYLLNKLGSCGRSPDRATAGTVRRPARASLPRFIEKIRRTDT